ncbi:hypothetical protein NDA18_004334 [Ustilago nuda]|nr:hypothetical protein NDA18_004334 [Ustilago nuda]
MSTTAKEETTNPTASTSGVDAPSSTETRLAPEAGAGGGKKKHPQAGRFIENISTHGSRASAEDQPQPPKEGEIAEREMRAVQAKPFRRVWKKKPTFAPVQRSTCTATNRSGAGGGQNYHTPSTEASTTSQNPSSSDHEKDSAKHHICSSCSDEQVERGDQYHKTLSALYPLTHFLGFRPLSHPHTPPSHRLTPSDAAFNRFHYICGRILSLGLPVTGSYGSLAQLRNPSTNRLELMQMYSAQTRSHITDTIHTTISAFIIISLLSLLSRSPFHRSHHSPLIIGAFATEAVVSFYAYRTPLAQPKNILLGNTLSYIIGMAIQLAFTTTNYSVSAVYGFDWAAAASSVGAAVLVMELMGVVHPPGAAFALLSVTSEPTERLGWWLVPITVIGSLVVVAWAMVVNNLGGRRWPENWLYKGAVSDLPVIGPESLPFANSPIEWPQRREHGAQPGNKRKRVGEEKGKKGIEEKEMGEKEKGFYRVPNSGTKLTTPYTPQPQHPAPAVVVNSRMIQDPTLTTTQVIRNNSKGSNRSRRSVVVHVNHNVRSMSTPAVSMGVGGEKGKGKEHVPAAVPTVPAVQWRTLEPGSAL